MKERNLGRGLSDLLNENFQDIQTDEVIQELELNRIKPNPDQPRTAFNEKKIKELSASIVEHGIIQPIIVKPSGENYILVAGERRLKAAEMAGLHTVPAIVRDYNMIYLAELAILENIQREDLNPIEEAVAYHKLINKYGLTHEQVGKKVGKSRSYITNQLGLLDLPEIVINAVINKEITAGHARALSKIKDSRKCLELFYKVIDQGMTVRDIETEIKRLKENIPSIPKKVLEQHQKELNNYFNALYNIKVTKKHISISYSTEEELQDIIKRMKE